MAEDMHAFSTSNIDYRISAFLSCPQRYQLVVDDYYAADLFRSHGNRGSTYLFLRWCVDRYGPELLPALLHSQQKGAANLEVATGSTFGDLYRRWSLAIFQSGLDPTDETGSNERTASRRSICDRLANNGNWWARDSRELVRMAPPIVGSRSRRAVTLPWFLAHRLASLI